MFVRKHVDETRLKHANESGVKREARTAGSLDLDSACR
jgi:hypothetical protein